MGEELSGDGLDRDTITQPESERLRLRDTAYGHNGILVNDIKKVIWKLWPDKLDQTACYTQIPEMPSELVPKLSCAIYLLHWSWILATETILEHSVLFGLQQWIVRKPQLYSNQHPLAANLLCWIILNSFRNIFEASSFSSHFWGTERTEVLLPYREFNALLLTEQSSGLHLLTLTISLGVCGSVLSSLSQRLINC